MLVAVIPAHNEEHRIAAAVRSLRQQASPPDFIVVSADNCTDGTVEEAEAAGAYVFEGARDVHEPTGALDQAVQRILPALGDRDALLVVDTDSALRPSSGRALDLQIA